MRLAPVLKARLRAVLTSMHHDPVVAASLRDGLIRYLAPVHDEQYSDISHMLATVQATALPFADFDN